MFWINAISRDQSRDERCFVFESFTIAQIISDKLEREGFEVDILNQDWEAITQIPEDPHRRLMGAWILQMSARAIDFLEHWIGKNVPVEAVEADAGRLAAQLLADAAAMGLTIANMELDEETAETYIREAIVHLNEPARPGD